MKLLQEKGEDIPIFVARDLGKLPPITFDNIDVSCLLNDIKATYNESMMLKEAVQAQNSLTKSFHDSITALNARVTLLENNIVASSKSNQSPAASTPSGSPQEQGHTHTTLLCGDDFADDLAGSLPTSTENKVKEASPSITPRQSTLGKDMNHQPDNDLTVAKTFAKVVKEDAPTNANRLIVLLFTLLAFPYKYW